MADITRGDVHTDALHDDFGLAWRETDESVKRYPAATGNIFPEVEAKKSSGTYLEVNLEDWKRVQASTGGLYDKAPTVEFGVSSGSYECVKHWAKTPMSHEVEDDSDVNEVTDAQNLREFVDMQVHMEIESSFIADAFITGKWGTSASITNKWSDSGVASTPLEDIDTADTTISDNTGRRVNTGILGLEVWKKLRRHPAIRDWVQNRTGGTSRAMGDLEDLAAATGVERWFVPEGFYNSSAKNVTASYSRNYGNGMLLLHLDGNPGTGPMKLRPNAGAMFWRKFEGQQFHHRTWTDEEITVDYIQATMKMVFKVLSTALGYWIESPVA